MIELSDTIRDNLPYYLRMEENTVVEKTLHGVIGEYDLFPTDSGQIFFHLEESAAWPVTSLSGTAVGESLPYSLWVNSVFFLLFATFFVLLAFVFRLEGSVLKANYRSVISFGKPSVSTQKSQVTNVEAWGEFNLLAQTVFIFSVFIFSWLWGQGISYLSIGSQAICFVVISLVLALFLYLKVLGYRLIGTFFLRGDIQSWINSYSRVMELLGLVLFLPAVLYVYLLETRDVMLMVVLTFFLISQLVVYGGVLNIFVKNKIGPFYFFVYLCGTEIAPYFLVYKMVLLVLNIAGDYMI